MPETTSELVVRGALGVVFAYGAFAGVSDLRKISVDGATTVVFEQSAGVDLKVLNLYLDVENCNHLRFEKNSFVGLQGPMSVTIRNCESVVVDGDTFSWLLNLSISNVTLLSLGSGAFSLEPSAYNVGNHGPEMKIALNNTNIPQITKGTFGSSAARVYLERVDIRAIRTGAFSANTYNVVMAINCSIHLIEEDSFSENSLINYLDISGSTIKKLQSKAFRSAIGNINISHTRFDNVESGAINTTVATVNLLSNEFHEFKEKGFELSSWNTLNVENNAFDELPPNAIEAPPASIHKLVFKNNEIETMHPESLSFIGKAAASHQVEYANNFYGKTCHCNISDWLAKGLGEHSGEAYATQSFCTVNEFFARCFNVPEQNMLFSKFIKQVCTKSPELKCETYISKNDGVITEIKNPRFPHKSYQEEGLSNRNKKVIGIVIVVCAVCVLVAMFISFVRCLRRRGHCVNLKNLLISSNNSCGAMCGRLCSCRGNLGLDNARSISQLSVNEYSERHRLNEARAQEPVQEYNLQRNIAPQVETDDKDTQTLPEQLTPEILEYLKENLNNSDNTKEAQEMIEHLYVLSKFDDIAPRAIQENIYEMPFQNTTNRIGRNNTRMNSVGTMTDRRITPLSVSMPVSPYHRAVPLQPGYFDPSDLAVHLYAEIANDRNRPALGSMPDVLGDQAAPRGPYLRAVLQPNNRAIAGSSSGSQKKVPAETSAKPEFSGKMVNRPLPAKPATDTGEGGSAATHG